MNTHFFHISTLVHRYRNHIQCIKCDNSSWVTGQEEVSNVLVDFFKNLFTSSGSSFCSLYMLNFIVKTHVLDASNSDLVAPITDLEITTALHAMGPLKCPGVDGLQGAGGINRDSVGLFVAGFAHHLWLNSSTTAELWAIHNGPLPALKMNISHLVVESDSTSTIYFCKSDVSPPWYLRGLQLNILQLVNSFQVVIFVYNPRGENMVDGVLSKKALVPSVSQEWIAHPPPCIL